MDPVHYRGTMGPVWTFKWSMDPLQNGGSMDLGPCFVLTLCQALKKLQMPHSGA